MMFSHDIASGDLVKRATEVYEDRKKPTLFAVTRVIASSFKEEILCKGAQPFEELPYAQSSCDSAGWGRLAGN
ncbi:hypothetical protein PR002_g23679 [Phytophthora rubi]|uniref:Uncharacterized protein n=1 Tax=Phytophthora rubi TaxID=129364 RepID=A0A6A3IFX7_9STRA|nr:hypothetical protein PR002_g23679 [Phytophthora rubi]